jgi:hypothetical protein
MTKINRFAGLLLGATFALAPTLVGCSVDDGDLTRWETTLGGPRRLSAVVIHDKYPHALRVKAAMSLVRMKPRKGKSEGIERLIKGALVCDPEFNDPGEACATTELTPEARGKLLADLVPLIVAELTKPPPEPAQGGQPVADPSIPYKDVAYLMLTYEGAQVVSDPAVRKQLEDALTAWAMADFENRLNNRSQAYGMEQLLRHIGPSAVKDLPSLMTRESRNLGKMADIIAKIADKGVREEASKKLVGIGQYVSSKKWRDDRLPELKEANRKAGFDPSEKQLTKQMSDFQNESMTRVFASMKKVGGSAVVAYALDLASDKKEPTARRQTALAALEGHIDRKNDKQIERLFKLAKSEAPPQVIDQAFRRIRELPRDKVASTLYGFFDTEDWKIRRLAGATILQMSKVKHIDEFLKELATKAEKNFNLPEAITYGAYLAGLKDGDALKTLEPHMKSGNAKARLAALSYWYEKGTKNDLDKIKAYQNDLQSAPKCKDEDKCDWTCLVVNGDKKESKAVKTVGDFVTHCIAPKMKATDPEKDKKSDKDKAPKKGDTDEKKDGDKGDK